MPPADDSTWQQANLAAIMRRLAWMSHLPDGVIYDERAGMQQIRILKSGSHIQLYFVDPKAGTLEGPMSRIDLERPLHLQAGYTQAALLSLLWQPDPRRVCVLGFGGGRISMLLQHHLPEVTVDNVDIDPAFLRLAPRYFGIGFDDRQRLFIGDAREFLEQAADRAYDIIVLDAFGDDGDQLDHLASRQFYQLCGQRLAKQGVLCANILRSDPRFAQKIKTLHQQFPSIAFAELKRSLIVFGSAYQQRVGAALAKRAAELQTRHGFDFPFAERAAELRGPRQISHQLQQQIQRAPIMSDCED